MKKNRKITIGLVFLSMIVLSVIQSNERTRLDVDLNNLTSINQAQAESGVSCIDNGYKNWNDSNGCGPDGMDCLCIEREKVKNDCD